VAIPRLNIVLGVFYLKDVAIIMYLTGLVGPWLMYLSDLFGNNFDAHFSDDTKRKLRVPDNSFLRKIIPLKEGDVNRDGTPRLYRYFLYPRALALFIQSIILLLGLIALAIHLLIVPFIPDLVFIIVGLTLYVIFAIYISIVNIASQLHL
jgi:hypothetical protein